MEHDPGREVVAAVEVDREGSVAAERVVGIAGVGPAAVTAAVEDDEDEEECGERGETGGMGATEGSGSRVASQIKPRHTTRPCGEVEIRRVAC